MGISYVLPLRWEDDTGLDELTVYLRRLALAVDDVLVVDGSPSPLFERHALAWHDIATHVRPDQRFHFVMPKVDGVLTGVELAQNETVVVADDDVRY
ncbi:MAG: glycosyltransferase family 2 protein, partial [Actinomycetota bacterium]